jgi:TPR repeat protein
MCNFARCLQDGVGVEKDEEDAVTWYARAAAEGDEDAFGALEDLEASGVRGAAEALAAVAGADGDDGSSSDGGVDDEAPPNLALD